MVQDGYSPLLVTITGAKQEPPVKEKWSHQSGANYQTRLQNGGF